MLTPAPLYPGARVALVAPASPVPPERLSPAVEAVRALGLEPVVYPSCRLEHRRGYLAAPDPVRAGDIQAAFCDNSIAGVLCIRGGYGANRILPLLDWAAIARHPKVFAGYSDITALHIALNQRCGLVTYHTIMPSTEYWEPVDPFSMGELRRALFGGLTGVLPLPEGAVPVPLAPGRAEGVLCGGNLTLVCASLGTPWEIGTGPPARPPAPGASLYTRPWGSGRYCRDIQKEYVSFSVRSNVHFFSIITQLCRPVERR